jgi:dTDP-4-amino-4,6-dideoxygalactose transaminase
MDEINSIARTNNLAVVEDAAQAYQSTYKGRPAGSLSAIGCFSCHETKNIVCGEGGAFVTSDDEMAARARVLCEKGTNRGAFLKGEKKNYTWIDIGSSYHPSELVAAFLKAQLEAGESILSERVPLWNQYYAAFENLENEGIVRRPTVPAHCAHNGHLFYLLLANTGIRDRLIEAMREEGIETPFHYIPLHNSPAGKIYGRSIGQLDNTEDVASRLIRLPLFANMGGALDIVVDHVTHHLSKCS